MLSCRFLVRNPAAAITSCWQLISHSPSDVEHLKRRCVGMEFERDVDPGERNERSTDWKHVPMDFHSRMLLMPTISDSWSWTKKICKTCSNPFSLTDGSTCCNVGKVLFPWIGWRRYFCTPRQFRHRLTISLVNLWFREILRSNSLPFVFDKTMI